MHIPAATVDLTIGQTRLHGSGYVEQLRMTLPPWKFPYPQLRWGRFIAEQDWLVWIDWSNPQTGAGRSWIASPAGFAPSGSVHESSVTTANVTPATRLSLHDPRIFHEGALHQSLGLAGRLIAPLIPSSFLNTKETKWISRGTLESPSGRHEGLALHELVHFASTPTASPGASP